MALARVTAQDASNTGATSSPASATYPSTPTQGNLLVAVAVAAGGTTNEASMSITSAGWTKAVGGAISASSGVQIWYKVAGAGESTTVTLTASGSPTACRLAIYEYDGFVGTPTLDKTAAGVADTGVTSMSTGTTATTTAAAEALVAAIGINNTPAGISWTNSFATILAASRILTGERIVAAAAAYETTASWTTAAGAIGILATFKDVVTAVQRGIGGIGGGLSLPSTGAVAVGGVL